MKIPWGNAGICPVFCLGQSSATDISPEKSQIGHLQTDEKLVYIYTEC
jgi:hypothetical protein